MDSSILWGVLVVFISWGTGAFVAKYAANRLGLQGAFWDVIGYFFGIVIFSLFVFKYKDLVSQFQENKIGVGLAFLAGMIGSMGAVGFYYLLTKREASSMIPLTALYPALTVVLAIIFLNESITTTKLVGIVLSLIAIYLLAK